MSRCSLRLPAAGLLGRRHAESSEKYADVVRGKSRMTGETTLQTSILRTKVMALRYLNSSSAMEMPLNVELGAKTLRHFVDARERFDY